MKKGFTILEMLTVISIIGVLSTIVLFELSAVRQNSASEAKLFQTREFQKAIEYFYAENGTYPGSLGLWHCLYDHAVIPGWGNECWSGNGTTFSLSLSQINQYINRPDNNDIVNLGGNPYRGSIYRPFCDGDAYVLFHMYQERDFDCGGDFVRVVGGSGPTGYTQCLLVGGDAEAQSPSPYHTCN